MAKKILLPKFELRFVDPATKEVVSEGTMEELEEAARIEKSKREAECGPDKSCGCIGAIRDPGCQSRYPLACPWEEFGRFKREAVIPQGGN